MLCEGDSVRGRACVAAHACRLRTFGGGGRCSPRMRSRRVQTLVRALEGPLLLCASRQQGKYHSRSFPAPPPCPLKFSSHTYPRHASTWRGGARGSAAAASPSAEPQSLPGLPPAQPPPAPQPARSRRRRRTASRPPSPPPPPACCKVARASGPRSQPAAGSCKGPPAAGRHAGSQAVRRRRASRRRRAARALRRPGWPSEPRHYARAPAGLQRRRPTKAHAPRRRVCTLRCREVHRWLHCRTTRTAQSTGQHGTPQS